MVSARLIRSERLAIKEKEFILAARVSGQSNMGIMRHMLPNVISTVVVVATLSVATGILTESALSYFGLGIQSPNASWVSMLSGAQGYIFVNPMQGVYPGALIVLTVLGVNFQDEGLHKTLDIRDSQAGELRRPRVSRPFYTRGSNVTMQRDQMTKSQLAIDGGDPVRIAPFPSWPVYDEREERLLLEVLRSGNWGEVSGSEVTTFAARFAAYQGAQYGICVPNGTMAIQLGLKALGIGAGDEVITTPYTFIATADAALLLGAKPVFVDVKSDTCNVDPDRLAAAITPRTKAIVPVHIGGQPADMDGVTNFANEHGLFVPEDASQAGGAEWKRTRIGAIGDLGCFSFQAGKNINAGECGIVVTNDPELAEICWSLHNVGRIRGGEWYQHELLGWNFRMTEWQAAVLHAQLDRLPEQEPIRERSARYLDEAIATIDGLSPVDVDPRMTRHAHHLYPARYDAAAFGGHTRDLFLRALPAEGITCVSAGYVPLTSSPAIRRTIAEAFREESLAQIDTCPIAEEVSRDVFWLTQVALLGDQEALDSILASIRKIQTVWR